MKRFLSKSLLGIALISGATISSCSCNKYIDEELKTGTELPITKNDEEEKQVETTEGEENEEFSVDKKFYSQNEPIYAYVYGQVGQKKRLTPTIDGVVVNASDCNWVSDKPNYISVDSNGIIDPSTDLSAVKSHVASQQQACIDYILSSGRSNISELSEDEFNYWTYRASTDVIIKATLKSDKSKYCAFRIRGDFNKLTTTYANEGQNDVVIHRVPFGVDSTVTYDFETEPVGQTTAVDEYGENPYTKDVFRTHIIYFENHLDPHDGIIYGSDSPDFFISGTDFVDVYYSEISGIIGRECPADHFADCDLFRIINVPSPRSFVVDFKYTTYHPGEFEVFKLTGESFKVTVNVV